MNENDLKRVEAHLKRTFGNPHVAVKARPKQKDSAGVSPLTEYYYIRVPSIILAHLLLPPLLSVRDPAGVSPIPEYYFYSCTTYNTRPPYVLNLFHSLFFPHIMATPDTLA